MPIKDWTIEEDYGYHPITTFYIDFGIAERFGTAAIRNTFNRAFEEWKTDYKYLTELVMVMNWKIWEHSGYNYSFAKLYDELWRQADSYAVNNLEGDELSYFYRTTD